MQTAVICGPRWFISTGTHCRLLELTANHCKPTANPLQSASLQSANHEQRKYLQFDVLWASSGVWKPEKLGSSWGALKRLWGGRLVHFLAPPQAPPSAVAVATAHLTLVTRGKWPTGPPPVPSGRRKRRLRRAAPPREHFGNYKQRNANLK